MSIMIHDGNNEAGHAVWCAIELSQSQCSPWSFVREEYVLQAYADLQLRENAGTPLYGMAFGVKDNIDVAGLPTACGSPLYSNNVPHFDASCVSLLRQAGAIPVGKCVTAEFAFTQPGPTSNPWNSAYTPGGSSSGSAAAVASGAVAFALGTQTGGSIIRPAAYCGVLGFKPTSGLVHRSGLHLLSDTLDTIGWFARSVPEIQAVAQVLLPALGSASTVPVVMPASALHIAIIRASGLASLTTDGAHTLAQAVDKLASSGAHVREVDVDDVLAELQQCQRTIMVYEMARGLHAEYWHDGASLSNRLVTALQSGIAVDGSDYQKARKDVADLESRLLQDLAGTDFILTPSATGAAPLGLSNTGDSVFNRVWTVLGWPALHLPTRFDAAGLPMGVQLVGRPYLDGALLDAARLLHAIIDGR